MNTPKNFVLQLGALLSLYISLASFLTLVFSIINVAILDAADTSYRVAASTEAIRFSLATVIVFFPVYLTLTRIVNNIRRLEQGTYLTLTRWLIYLSLLAGGGMLLGDLVVIINAYLDGEITTRFLLKAGVLAVVIAAACYYYLKDTQNYWQTHVRQSVYFGAVTAVVVAVTVLVGFNYGQTPSEVRETRIDDNQIEDLRTIQRQIESHYQTNEALPESIAEVFVGLTVPKAPIERTPYRYQTTATTTYQLCATFAFDSATSDYTYIRPVYDSPNNNWSHGAGEWCFDRSVATKNPIQL